MASKSRSRSSSAGRVKKKYSPKRGAGRGLFRFPSWLLWLGGLLITAAYIYFFYHFFVSPYSFRWRAIYGEPTYPEGYEVRGIDISHYQNRINWDKLAKASLGDEPVSFVFVKSTEGKTLCDDNFKSNFSSAKRNGLIRGAYHFFVPGIDASEQAYFFLKTAVLDPGDLPPVLDVEKKGDLTSEELRRDVKVWLDIAEQAYGVKPILYTNYDFKLKHLNTPEFDAYPYWIAHYYVNELKYKGKWAFWQHTDCGKVSGVKGFVDCNIFNGSLEELKELTLPKKR